MGRKQQGFSLIELLIVVTIIMVIAAIAIPNFLRARISANEASAVTSMHAVTTSEIGYSSAYPSIGFSATLSDMGSGGGGCSPTAACFLDQTLASATPQKDGYAFTYVGDGLTPSLGFTFNGDPITRGITGQTSYFADQTNSIHYNPTATAGLNDPTL